MFEFDTNEGQSEILNEVTDGSTRELVLNALSVNSVELDELIRATKLPSRIVRAVLIELSLAGKVQNDSSQKYPPVSEINLLTFHSSAPFRPAFVMSSASRLAIDNR